jgi:hypothetical protein
MALAGMPLFAFDFRVDASLGRPRFQRPNYLARAPSKSAYEANEPKELNNEDNCQATLKYEQLRISWKFVHRFSPSKTTEERVQNMVIRMGWLVKWNFTVLF